MARLIGNYSVPGQPEDSAKTEASEPNKDEKTVSEFEKRAFARLGGSIAFVMKGKSVLWTGDKNEGGSKA
ncbi:MAG TPA: hypothetical protein VFA38_11915 [Nitrospirales bacterium]|nr:hypothetical protein [Nitrospirales bacterium]